MSSNDKQKPELAKNDVSRRKFLSTAGKVAAAAPAAALLLAATPKSASAQSYGRGTS